MGAVVMGGYVFMAFGFMLGDKGLFGLGAVLFVGGVGHMCFVSRNEDEEEGEGDRE